MQSQAFRSKHGHWSEELEELRTSWQRRCGAVLAQQEEAELTGARWRRSKPSVLAFVCWGTVIVTQL